MVSAKSFDVFDTVLTRLVGDPDHVHHLTGRRLAADGCIDVSPAVYAAVRRDVDDELRAREGRRHVTLARIAEEAAARLGLPSASATHVLEAELQVERELSRAVPGAGDRLAAARRETGRGVVFVSDTPLPESFLLELLSAQQLWAEGDRLYGSGDRGVGKDSGELFDLIAADVGAPPENLLHVGDNLRSDVAQARRRGWRATHDGRASLNAHERRLELSSSVTDGLSSRLAGASRLARLEAVRGGVDPALASVAGGVGLPLMMGFGSWVLRQARLLELDRFYFVARDGEIILHVAASMARRTNASISCHYLYGSRLAWNLPSTSTYSGRNRDDWLHDERDQLVVSVRKKLGRLGLTPEEARLFCDSSLLAPAQADRDLSPEEQQQIYALLAEGPLAEELARRALEQRELMLRYLDQEGVTANGRVGIVDVGWRGRTNRSLEEVLRAGGRPLPAAHLFMALLGDARELMGPDLHDRSQAWLFDESRNQGPTQVTNSHIVMIESFTKSPQPYTGGYRLVGERVEPQLVRTKDASAMHAVVDGYRRALLLALDILLEGRPKSEVDLRSVAWRQLVAFWTRPHVAEAAAWGRLPWSDDYDGTGHVPLAAPLGTRAVLEGVRRSGLGWRPQVYLWRAGTAAVSASPVRVAHRALTTVQAGSKRLRRLPDRLRAEIAIRGRQRSPRSDIE